MRFVELKGLTSLPIDRVLALFADTDVAAVLPVNRDRPDQDAILVATPPGLVVVTRLKGKGGDIVARWTRWDRVRLSADDEAAADETSRYHLAIRVGRRTFHALLSGGSGKAALRDFVVAVGRGTRDYIGYVNFDASSMLPEATL